MNRGLIQKGIREIWAAAFLCGLGVMIFEAIAAYVFWLYQDQFASNVDQIEIMRRFLSSLVGSDIAGNVGPDALNSIPWVHPLFLALFWAFAILVCTRVPSGEIDRGTVDILLAMPLSRSRIFAAETVLAIGGGVVVLAMALIGSGIGQLLIPAESRPEIHRLAMVLINLYVLYLVIAGMTLLFSSLSDRRGRAVSSAFGVILVLFLWNFLAEYWEPAKQAGVLNVLSYYKPMPILTEGIFPTKDVLVLLACAAPLWIVAWQVFERRDICTV